MGTYITRASLDDVADRVQEQLEAGNFTIRRRTRASVLLLRGRMSSGGLLTDMKTSVRLEPLEDGVLLQDDFRPGLHRRIGMLVPMCWLLTMVMLVACWPDEFVDALTNGVAYCAAVVTAIAAHMTGPMQEFPTHYLIASVAFLSIFPAWVRLANVEGRLRKAVGECHAAFRVGLAERIGLRILALSKPRPLPRFTSASFVVALSAAPMVLLYKVHPWAFGCVCPYVAFLLLTYIFPMMCDDGPSLYPKAIGVAAGARVVLLNSLVLLLIFLGVALTASHYIGEKLTGEPGPVSVKRIRQVLGDGVPFFDGTQSGIERLSQLNAVYDRQAAEFAEKNPDRARIVRLLAISCG